MRSTQSWDEQDETWLLAGGYPKADVSLGSAWIAAISSNGGAEDLSTLIAPLLKLSGSSSILSATFNDGLWALGGYKANGKRTHQFLVIPFPVDNVIDLSQAVGDTTCVIWVGFSQLTQPPSKFIPKCELTSEKSALAPPLEKFEDAAAQNCFAISFNLDLVPSDVMWLTFQAADAKKVLWGWSSLCGGALRRP